MPKAPSCNGAVSGDQLRKLPKLAASMDETEADVLAFMTFPKTIGQKIQSTNRSSVGAKPDLLRTQHRAIVTVSINGQEPRY